MQFGTLATAKVLTDLKIFKALASDPTKEWTTDELATHSGSESQLLREFMGATYDYRIQANETY